MLLDTVNSPELYYQCVIVRPAAGPEGGMKGCLAVTRQPGGVTLVQTEVTAEVNSRLSNCLFKACQHSKGSETLHLY